MNKVKWENHKGLSEYCVFKKCPEYRVLRAIFENGARELVLVKNNEAVDSCIDAETMACKIDIIAFLKELDKKE